MVTVQLIKPDPDSSIADLVRKMIRNPPQGLQDADLPFMPMNHNTYDLIRHHITQQMMEEKRMRNIVVYESLQWIELTDRSLSLTLLPFIPAVFNLDRKMYDVIQCGMIIATVEYLTGFEVEQSIRNPHDLNIGAYCHVSLK